MTWLLILVLTNLEQLALKASGLGVCSGWHSVRRHTMKAFLIVVILVVILTQPLY